jgi:hypothetical protein
VPRSRCYGKGAGRGCAFVDLGVGAETGAGEYVWVMRDCAAREYSRKADILKS